MGSALRLWRLLYVLSILGGMLCGRPAAAEQPPADAALSILAPQDGATVSQAKVTLRLRISLPAERPLLVRVMIDGVEVVRTRDLILSSGGLGRQNQGESQISEQGIQQIEVPIPPRDCVLSVLAESSATATLPALTLPAKPLRLHFATPAAGTQPALRKPKLYVLAVGISEYQSPELRLQFPAKDATDFTAALERQQGHMYQAVQSRLLVDAQASKGNILDGLEWLQRQATQHDLTVLFLAGHGINNPNTGGYAFLPHDADLNAIKRTLVSDADIRSTLSSLAGKVLVFMDTCHAGNVLGPVRLRAVPDYGALMSELANSENGIVVFASSTGRQSSRESERWGNGAFTKAVVEGLRGRADFQRSGRITITMLDLYISERVKELTAGLQTPSTAKPSTLPDYPIAVVLPGDEPPAEPDVVEPPPAPLVTTVDQPAQRPPPTKERRAPHQKWWFWTALLGGTALVATGVGVGLALRPSGSQLPSGVSVFDRSF